MIDTKLQGTIKEELGLRVHEYLEAVTKFGFSGTVLLSKGNEILLHQGYGYQNMESGIEMDANSVLDVGSISKQFTAVGILKLVEIGKLTIKTVIGELFDLPTDKKDITIHQLLSHTSGLIGNLPGYGDFDTITKDEFLQKLFSSELTSTESVTHDPSLEEGFMKYLLKNDNMKLLSKYLSYANNSSIGFIKVVTEIMENNILEFNDTTIGNQLIKNSFFYEVVLPNPNVKEMGRKLSNFVRTELYSKDLLNHDFEKPMKNPTAIYIAFMPLTIDIE